LGTAAGGALPHAHPFVLSIFAAAVLTIPAGALAPRATLGNFLILGVPRSAFSNTVGQFTDATVNNFGNFFDAHSVLPFQWKMGLNFWSSIKER
jgi:hypothetical protein